ncbi:hypothetical protein BE08_30650 [Sorangium cellulosum]|uniref:Uncharacterized protein n=1 Tax=Sorangium cellulosum TaxID=56 RepID=A0A150NZ20_SORCE|nr:hypothetical protein BE08_30650 [Sorangium cellulosum]
MSPPVMLCTSETTVRNAVIWLTSVHSGVAAGSASMLALHVSARSACGLAEVTLRPCLRLPQTVRTRLSGSPGPGSTNVAQKSSLMPRTSRSSCSESYGAFLR